MSSSISSSRFAGAGLRILWAGLGTAQACLPQSPSRCKSCWQPHGCRRLHTGSLPPGQLCMHCFGWPPLFSAPVLRLAAWPA